ncbi:metallophosphoesterase [Bacilli bacterium]|uniref:metallophosphoesterase n=1 Tax=Oceanobacillus sp. FSL K6-0118 TaxID=2921418 RepID=UPI0006226BDD|nr:metallophosphoesterase [Bacilli bacterium VT-13-104]PZD81453.1 metallophosphoesterase [Bacilli bacterium]PZD85672.1 metallophosphoesterase [Bacilli bacterium]PZD88876.1 metallophosphoesterase [Bacilli bacterium]RCO04444.1 metallophosphoesterase [Bacilli bacterium]
MDRRTFLKRGIGSLITLFGLSGGGYFYAKELEPRMIKFQHELIQSKKIPPSFDNFKIAQFSDTHIGFHYTVDQLSELIEKINANHPDVIVFTGDLVDNPNEFDAYTSIQEKLKRLDAPYGKFWIYGNHDHGGYGTEIIKKVMKESDFHLLQNSHTVIEKEADRFILAGIDDVMLGKPDLTVALNQVNHELFTILLAHEPDYADIASKYPIDVQLSGHSHGGQVRLPWIGDLYTPDYAEKYVKGKYMLNKDTFTLYVNSGIGTTRLPYRFLCKPEIHIFTLKHS